MNYKLGSILNSQTSTGGHEKDVVSRRLEGHRASSGHAPTWDTFQTGPAPWDWCQKGWEATEMAGHLGCARHHPEPPGRPALPCLTTGCKPFIPQLCSSAHPGTPLASLSPWAPGSWPQIPFQATLVPCVPCVNVFYTYGLCKKGLWRLKFMVPSLGSPVNSPSPSYPPPPPPRVLPELGPFPSESVTSDPSTSFKMLFLSQIISKLSGADVQNI